MMSEIPAELCAVMEEIERDKSLWRRVAGLNGARFVVRFCCNSQAVRRVLVQQEGRGVLRGNPAKPGEMPSELQLIKDKCMNDLELRGRASAFTRGKFDIIFMCQGFGLWDALVKEVS